MISLRLTAFGLAVLLFVSCGKKDNATQLPSDLPSYLQILKQPQRQKLPPYNRCPNASPGPNTWHGKNSWINTTTPI